MASIMTSLAGDDWPRWRGPRQDGIWRESGLVERFESPHLPIRWSAPTSSGYSGPTVADGRVYVSDRVAKLLGPTADQLRRRGGVTWSHPAFAYRHIFARNDKVLVCADLSASPPSTSLPADEVESTRTTVTITDRVLVRDTSPFGINLGGDAYYSGAALVKRRAAENFEGTTYRQCHVGPVNDANGATTWFTLNDTWKELMAERGRYTILSGPSKGTTGKIKAISTKKAKHQGEMKEFMYFEYDRKVTPDEANMGLMIEAERLRDGQMHTLDGYWCSKHNEISIGDVASESFGHAALNLKGSEQKAHYRFSTHYQRYGETNGLWNVRFRAKAKTGSPKLTVSTYRYGEKRELRPHPEWRQHALKIRVHQVPEPENAKESPHLLFTFEAEDGDILLDDVEIWMEGDTNPTAFRDDCVEMLRAFRPGCLRNLQMGGSTLDNILAPPLKRHAFSSQRSSKVGPTARHSRHPYSLHEMYVLCEHIGCDPWYCLPGTFSQDEIQKFMEYLGAPADVGYGKKRAALGQPKPWTEVFRTIHVEFGNEAWNNAGPYQCGGFNGRDYWKDLIAAGKASPHFGKNIVFHAAGQAANSWLNGGIFERVPNADRFGVAPYIIQRISKEELAFLDTDVKFFRWAFAWPIWRSRHEKGAMLQNWELSKKAGIELSIYEVNHHITHGDGPLEPRNKLVTSIGGGLNVLGNMLLMLKEHHLRTQALFSLVQHSYRAHGIGPVRLWGTALCMRKGKERYRPTFLGCAMANRVMGGDLVETQHTDANPTFTAKGRFGWRRPLEELKDLPVVWSYAFRDGKRRGLVLLNIDTSRAQPVTVAFDGKVAGGRAKRWMLSANAITAGNEFEGGEPQVKLAEREIAGFESGYKVDMPPHSAFALGWEME